MRVGASGDEGLVREVAGAASAGMRALHSHRPTVNGLCAMPAIPLHRDGGLSDVIRVEAGAAREDTGSGEARPEAGPADRLPNEIAVPVTCSHCSWTR
ncbi:hypothetical protein QFZ22_001348 [Streptomyces canus]|uniref:Uncharacterized protein n=1 Tax=Streptomyces canus TaxID=58343 RepID=A0AAW8F967_9ACTN|nr:hypothetical protein [Streptomyces canus]